LNKVAVSYLAVYPSEEKPEIPSPGMQLCTEHVILARGAGECQLSFKRKSKDSLKFKQRRFGYMVA
jgi:hypothetical protein